MESNETLSTELDRNLNGVSSTESDIIKPEGMEFNEQSI